MIATETRKHFIDLKCTRHTSGSGKLHHTKLRAAFRPHNSPKILLSVTIALYLAMRTIIYLTRGFFLSQISSSIINHKDILLPTIHDCERLRNQILFHKEHINSCPIVNRSFRRKRISNLTCSNTIERNSKFSRSRH